jgi:hypothetical protein
MIKNLYWSSYKVPDILVTFYWNLDFLDRYLKNTRIPNFMKIRPVSAELFQANTRTATTKLTVAFRNFVKAPKKRLKQIRIVSVCGWDLNRVHCESDEL